MCLSIQCVHNLKILHRDIKSHNIFLMKDMSIKLGDFGIAKVFNSTKSRAQTMIGTPYYFSPEMCKGETYSYKTDIWSLGVLLYEITVLEYPFKGKNIS